MLIEKTLRDYLKEVRSDSPAPGGGSVAAYSSALGASLTNMVMALTESKKSLRRTTRVRAKHNERLLQKTSSSMHRA